MRRGTAGAAKGLGFRLVTGVLGVRGSAESLSSLRHSCPTLTPDMVIAFPRTNRSLVLFAHVCLHKASKTNKGPRAADAFRHPIVYGPDWFLTYPSWPFLHAWSHQVFEATKASAALAAGIFHRREVAISAVKGHMAQAQIPTRV